MGRLRRLVRQGPEGAADALGEAVPEAAGRCGEAPDGLEEAGGEGGVLSKPNVGSNISAGLKIV